MRPSIFIMMIVCLLAGVTALANPYVRATESGSVHGRQSKYNTMAFLGIPYAAPPVGALRWKAPQPAPPWSGTFEAKEFGPACAQKGNFFSNVPAEQFGEPIGSEDCLHLNIWRPRHEITQKRPVVVWIHGGSNFKGTASDPMYDGAYVSAQSEVVYVSMNYRLGLLGAISLSALQNEGTDLDRSGNFVTLDLIRALQWIQDNIENFGGDKNNVTIMGQSAGCMNVWGLLQSPMASGLFHKAVCSAGVPNTYPKAFAQARSHDFVVNLVVQAGLAKDEDAAKKFLKSKSEKWVHDFLYERPVEELVMAQDFLIPIQHIVDGLVFPHGMEGLAFGAFNRVPLILGGTVDEGTYLAGMPFLRPTDKELWAMIQNPPPDLQATDIIKTLNLPTYRAYTKIGSFAISAMMKGIAWGSKIYENRVYRYAFDWKETPSPWREVFGAVHGMDAMFYLGNFITDQPNFAHFAWTPENKESREELRRRMNKYFRGFFWTGDVNADIQDPAQRWDGDILFK
ncbi:carboxylesterase/lipase family protein [Bdellovibrio sp. HCB2-146]|uniref:carboxylesterase/lipase family protein n=1 Tax=Bdellovibrio sp. HCB2-146 TaxID=3394362 RepID=UPI0039BD60D6